MARIAFVRGAPAVVAQWRNSRSSGLSDSTPQPPSARGPRSMAPMSDPSQWLREVSPGASCHFERARVGPRWWAYRYAMAWRGELTITRRR